MDLSSDDALLAPETIPNYSLTLAYVENAYIIFWITKDLFWSWGTGDLTKGRDLAIFYEAMAISFGTLSIFIYLLTSYLYRRNIIRLLDSITVVFWISANFVWMCGEFFLRYDNLAYDDMDEGNDSDTRLASAALFSLGLCIQGFILIILLLYCGKSTSIQRGMTGRIVELSNVKVFMRYPSMFVPFAPQGSDNPIDDRRGSFTNPIFEEEESTVLF